MKRDYRLYIPGAALVAVGLLVISVPEILVVLFASILCLAGIAALFAARQIQKQEIVSVRLEDWRTDKDTWKVYVQRRPRFTSCRHW